MMVSEHHHDNLQKNRAMRRLPPAGLKSTRIVSPLEMRATFGTENGQLSEMVNTRNIRTSNHYDQHNIVEQTLKEQQVQSPGKVRPAEIRPWTAESPVSLVRIWQKPPYLCCHGHQHMLCAQVYVDPKLLAQTDITAFPTEWARHHTPRDEASIIRASSVKEAVDVARYTYIHIETERNR